MGWDGPADLAQDAYAAALEPSRWDASLAKTGELLGGFSTGFHVVEKSTAAIRHQIISHPDAHVLQRYLDEEIWRLDPQAKYVAENSRFHVYTDTDHLEEDDKSTQEYLLWQRSNENLGHYLSACVPLGDDLVGGLSIHRKVADGATPPQTRRLLEQVAADFGRAIQLGFVHETKLNHAFWDGLLSERTEPALLLDECGRVLRAVPLLERLLTRHDGLDIVGGRLVAADQESDVKLQAVLSAVLAKSPRAGAARVHRVGSHRTLVVSAFPLVRPARHLAPAEAAALVTVVDPTAPPQGRGELWRQAFDLTAREAELAILLAAGHSVESAAAKLEMSRNTARVHLAHLFAKTGTTRQTELLQLLTRIGP